VFVFNAVADAVMKRFALPRPWLLHMSATKAAFPELHPLVYAEMKVIRRTKEMNVIRHQQVISDQPGGRFCAPDVCQRVLDRGVGHPGHGILGVDGYEEYIWLAQENMRTSRRCLTANVAVNAFAFRHNPSVTLECGKEKVKKW